MSSKTAGAKRSAASNMAVLGGNSKKAKKGEHKENKEVMIKGAWSPDEDEVMKQAVAQHGTDWKAIAKCVRGRTAKQCRDRYKLKLDPSINHGPWSPEEDQTLLKLHAEYGRQWTRIAKMMRGRTENSVKSRFASLQRSKIREWTEEEDRLLWDKREEGLSHEEIAEQFLSHRSVHAVKKRYERLYMRELAKKIRSEMPSTLKQPPQQQKQKSSFPINPRLVKKQTAPVVPPAVKEETVNPAMTSLEACRIPSPIKQDPDDFRSTTPATTTNANYPFLSGANYHDSSMPPPTPEIPTVDGMPRSAAIPHNPRSSRQSKFKRHRTSMTVLMQVIGEPANL